MSHTANFKLKTVNRDLGTCNEDDYSFFIFEDAETSSEIRIRIYNSNNKIKSIDVDISDYQRFNSGLDNVIDDVIKKLINLEGAIL